MCSIINATTHKSAINYFVVAISLHITSLFLQAIVSSKNCDMLFVIMIDLKC